MAILPPTVTEIFPVVAPVGTVVVMEVAVLAVTTVVVPLNATVLLTGVGSKFVPVMVTVVPTGPAAGVNEVIVGSGAVTVKLVALVAVFPATVTVIAPVVAPAGTVVVKDVAVLAVTIDVVPLNATVLLAAVVLKFVPVMVTVVPTGPEAGVKVVMVGSGAVTVKSEVVCTVIQLFTVTEIFPVVAPDGTVAVILEAVAAVTLATVPLKLTTLLVGEGSKFVPLMITAVPTAPEGGVKPLMEGEVDPGVYNEATSHAESARL